MRVSLIERMKSEIEHNLKSFLREEGIELSVAANDNYPANHDPLVELEAIEDSPLGDSALLSEIKVILGVQGKPTQCDMLIEGIYEALHPHHVTSRELAVLLMSLRVEVAHCVRPRRLKKRAEMRYIVEEIAANENREPAAAEAAGAE